MIKTSPWLSADEQREVYARLRWCYGDERALNIIAGQDKRAEADVQAWRGLGAPLMKLRTANNHRKRAERRIEYYVDWGGGFIMRHVTIKPANNRPRRVWLNGEPYLLYLGTTTTARPA